MLLYLAFESDVFPVNFGKINALVQIDFEITPLKAIFYIIMGDEWAPP